MQKVNDGGPAFPCETEYKERGLIITELHSGMNLRDYFAAKAMQASRSRNSQYQNWGDLAKDAYDIADAMLAAREGK